MGPSLKAQTTKHVAATCHATALVQPDEVAPSNKRRLGKHPGTSRDNREMGDGFVSEIAM